MMHDRSNGDLFVVKGVKQHLKLCSFLPIFVALPFPLGSPSNLQTRPQHFSHKKYQRTSKNTKPTTTRTSTNNSTSTTARTSIKKQHLQTPTSTNTRHSMMTNPTATYRLLDAIQATLNQASNCTTRQNVEFFFYKNNFSTNLSEEDVYKNTLTKKFSEEVARSRGFTPVKFTVSSIGVSLRTEAITGFLNQIIADVYKNESDTNTPVAIHKSTDRNIWQVVVWFPNLGVAIDNFMWRMSTRHYMMDTDGFWMINSAEVIGDILTFYAAMPLSTRRRICIDGPPGPVVFSVSPAVDESLIDVATRVGSSFNTTTDTALLNHLIGTPLVDRPINTEAYKLDAGGFVCYYEVKNFPVDKDPFKEQENPSQWIDRLIAAAYPTDNVLPRCYRFNILLGGCSLIVGVLFPSSVESNQEQIDTFSQRMSNCFIIQRNFIAHYPTQIRLFAFPRLQGDTNDTPLTFRSLGICHTLYSFCVQYAITATGAAVIVGVVDFTALHDPPPADSGRLVGHNSHADYSPPLLYF
jgi:hypothetical protein